MNAHTSAQLADAMAKCRSCGTDNRLRECPDWCRRMRGDCHCGKSLCGHCMRADY